MILTPFRLIEVWAKASFFLLWLIVFWVGNSILLEAGAPDLHHVAFTWTVNVGTVVLAVRTFRGTDEDKVAPRAPWRATAGRRSALVVAGLGTIGFFLELVAVSTLGGATTAFYVGHGLHITLFLAVVIYFLNSGVRTPPRATSFKLKAQL